MSKFFVGLRVRIKYVGELVRHVVGDLVGKTATITGFEPFYGKPHDCTIRVDGRGVFDAGTCQLEPAYDGNEVVSWESMRELWTPSRDEVRV